MAELLNSYGGLPEELTHAVQVLATERTSCSSDGYCSADEWDCSADSSCPSDGVCSDTCSSDGTSCKLDWEPAPCGEWVCVSEGPCSDTCSDTPSVTRPTDEGSLTLVSVTSTSISVRLASIPRAEYYELAYRLTTTTSAVYETFYGLTYTITGLSPGTTYLVNYRGVNSAGDGPFMTTALRVTTPRDVSSFDWTYAGLDSAGTPVTGAEKKSGYGIYVTADEWNELAGLVSDATGKSVTTVSSGDAISAAVVNTMARALGVSTVSAGGSISASFFNSLRSAYNALT